MVKEDALEFVRSGKITLCATSMAWFYTGLLATAPPSYPIRSKSSRGKCDAARGKVTEGCV